jgi:hypothetical protein
MGHLLKLHKLCTFTLESTHFVFNLCPFYTHDGASAKFSINSQETDYSAGHAAKAKKLKLDHNFVTEGFFLREVFLHLALYFVTLFQKYV